MLYFPRTFHQIEILRKHVISKMINNFIKEYRNVGVLLLRLWLPHDFLSTDSQFFLFLLHYYFSYIRKRNETSRPSRISLQLNEGCKFHVLWYMFSIVIFLGWNRSFKTWRFCFFDFHVCSIFMVTDKIPLLKWLLPTIFTRHVCLNVYSLLFNASYCFRYWHRSLDQVTA